MIKESLAKLQSLADTLNRETDELNLTFEQIEKQVGACRPGVSVWVNLPLVDGDQWELGYAKVSAHGDWRLVVRRGEDVLALTAAPRVVRVEAASYLPVLMDALNQRLERIVNSTHKAVLLVQECLKSPTEAAPAGLWDLTDE